MDMQMFFTLVSQVHQLQDALRDSNTTTEESLALLDGYRAKITELRSLVERAIAIAERQQRDLNNLRDWQSHHFAPLCVGDIVVVLYDHSLGRVEAVNGNLNIVRNLADGSLYPNQYCIELLCVSMTPSQRTSLTKKE